MAMKKGGSAEVSFYEFDVLREKVTNQWFVLFGKGYIGVQSDVLVICSDKKIISVRLKVEDREINQHI